MKIICFSIPAMVVLMGGSGFASTIVQTKGATLLNVGPQFAVPIEVDPFNTTLGTLTSVTVELAASFAGTVGVENLSAVPDKAGGIIAGSVTISNTSGSLFAEVFPSAFQPIHNLTAFDGTLDYGGTSGATDSVSGTTVTTTATAPPPASVLQDFSGTNQIFLTLIAKTFPLVQGMETESVSETANATATVTLTYDYTPASAVPEPATALLLAPGLSGLLWIYRRRVSRCPA
jgi:hypothetical protein